MEKFKFTVFTPVYNAGSKIERVIESLKKQTFKNFEWIIINDGSNDDSHEYIKKNVLNCGISNIKYINDSVNHGKPYNMNRCIDMAMGELFVPADADDTFHPETLAFFAEKWDAIKNKDKVSGINVLCYDADTKELCTSFYDKDGIYSNALLDTFVNPPKQQGERWGCVRVDLMKKFPYPHVEACTYYPISYTWYQLALNDYMYVCYNKPLRAYFYEPMSIVHAPHRFRLRKIKPIIHNKLWQLKVLTPYLMKHHKYLDILRIARSLMNNCIKFPIALCKKQ